jgi:predicted AAA+ superfamily ATPase
VVLEGKMRRIQEDQIQKDLKKKIVFIVGPRQVGKTWLSKEIAKSYENSVYLNYDHLEDRRIIQDEAWLQSTKFLILDELHKMPDWKNYLKGLYDTKPNELNILVTGSARLDTFRQSGDSLAGRFFAHRLLPFSLAELKGTQYDGQLDRLLERGGFPEPFLVDEAVDAARWRKQYIDGLIRDDIIDFENIQDLRAMQLVFELLRGRVGSPVSFSSIARDVGISPNTTKKYIQILEALFIVFRVSPHSRNVGRSLQKEPKIYFYDTGLVKDNPGAKFENLVAVSLLKHVLGKTDLLGQDFELKYLRTKDQREVDFCLTQENEPYQMLEVKRTDSKLAASLLYFKKKLEIPAVQIVMNLKRERREADIDIVRADSFLISL